MAENTKYAYRFLARIVVEALTPIAVGTGEKDVLSDALVVVDINGLPYIPGSSLAGVMRHAWEKTHQEALFGKQEGSDCWGSRVIVSDARMVGKGGHVLDGFCEEDMQDEFLKRFERLPIRQHVRINHQGTGAKNGKFDEQVVFKGCRFCFDLELLSEDGDSTPFEDLLNLFREGDFRVGGSVRHGLGQIGVVNCKTLALNLNEPADLECYLQYSSSLKEDFPGSDCQIQQTATELYHYQLNLQPENFFLFGSGFGDADADMTPVTEDYIVWDENGNPYFEKQRGLIPASSIKGALAHRVAYHWNRMQGIFADQNPEVLNQENPAVVSLFGSADPKNPKCGHTFFSDVYLETSVPAKLLNHVAIDPFTGGAAEMMLFAEKTFDGFKNQENLVFDIWVEKTVLQDETVKEALECALRDLCSGRLPLGGGVNRGHGAFYGSLQLDDACIFQCQ